jgi:hypothetical protein
LVQIRFRRLLVLRLLVQALLLERLPLVQLLGLLSVLVQGLLLLAR